MSARSGSRRLCSATTFPEGPRRPSSTWRSKRKRREQGLRPQLRAYNLPTEPWAFIIDRDGKITARFEGAFGAEELSRALDRVTAN